MLNNVKFKQIKNELIDNLDTIYQLMEGYREIREVGSKEDVLFYSDLMIGCYIRVSQLFVELNSDCK